MLTRALIVLLVLLNVSVALWWLLRAEPASGPATAAPTGVAELRLLAAGSTVSPASPSTPTAPLQEATPEAPASRQVAADPPRAPEPVEAEAPAAPPAPAPAAMAPQDAPQRCVALGPFADQAAAQAAQAKVGGALLQPHLREQAVAGATARFRVMMPPAESREAAQATVQRILAAGLSDYYIIGQGPDANAIALGQYRNREGAERRLAALREAGFQAQLSGGEGASSWWLQGALTDAGAAAGLRQRSGAAQQRSLDCAGLR